MNYNQMVINESCYKKEEIRKYNYSKKNKKSGYAKKKVFTKQTKREVRYNAAEQNGGKGNKFVKTYQYEKFSSMYERSQDSKMQAQNSSASAYYRNSRNYLEMGPFNKDFQNEDYEYYPPPLMAIPTTITFSPTPTLNERDRVINSLKGQIQAYKEILNHQKKNNFPLKINLACEKMRFALKTRQTLQPFLDEDGVITKTINFILEQTPFYEDCQLKIKKFSTLLGQETQHVEKLPIELNIDILLESKMKLTFLKEKLDDAYEETKNLSIFNEVLRGNLVLSSDPKIGQDFIFWKNEYLKFQSVSDKTVDNLCFSLEECASFFRSLIKGVDNEEVTQFNFEHIELVLQSFNDEITHSQMMNVIPSTILELLKEIKARIAKINDVQAAVDNATKLNSKQPTKPIIPDLSAVKEVKCYPTLLKFANLSRILPYLKYSITRDIFHSLSDLHKKDVVYVFLSPQNVLISGGGAVLCSAETVSKEEPIPDFNFFSPEIDSYNCLKNLTTDSSPDINQVADYYSLGKMIIWLSSKGENENYIEHSLNVMSRFPFIKKLISKEPKERPSFVELEEFMKFLPDLYYSYDISSALIENSTARVMEKSFETGSDLSTQTMVSKILDEQRYLIYKETEDSEFDSDDDVDDDDEDDDNDSYNEDDDNDNQDDDKDNDNEDEDNNDNEDDDNDNDNCSDNDSDDNNDNEDDDNDNDNCSDNDSDDDDDDDGDGDGDGYGYGDGDGDGDGDNNNGDDETINSTVS